MVGHSFLEKVKSPPLPVQGVVGHKARKKKFLVFQARPHLLLANASFFFIYSYVILTSHDDQPCPFGHGVHSLFNANSVVVGH